MTSEVDMIDMKARSKEGRGLSQRAGDHWIEIQKNTFMNWVNLQLQGSGLTVSDFEVDFDDGVRLCALVESLQNRKIGRVIKKPMNQHQSLENVTLALRAIAEDNIRLVNIGSEDIVNGSLKLILGLVWHLILRYQIGKTKFPPKKLMIAWLQAVIPECNITNFTSDWNDGVALHALIEYCQPGLCPHWRQISRHNRLENCTDAMKLANDQLNIPIVVRPEDFSSPHLDELSGMTYLSYYMMIDAPGYIATRREIRALLQQGTIDNFTTDWNDGKLLCTLVKSVGGEVPGWPLVSHDHEEALQNGIDAARKLGIEPIFSAKEIADPEVEHLGVMAYAAHFRTFKPVKIKQNKASMDGSFTDVYVKQEKHFVVNAEDGTSRDSIRPEVIGPDSIVPVRTEWRGNKCDCYFTPTETGQHKLNVYCDGENIPGCPVPFKVHSDRSKVMFDRLDRAVVGINSELKVDTTSAGQGEIRVEATSPSGRLMTLPVMYKDGVHTANFVPTEVGDWEVSMIYDGEPVQGSPYTVKVFDPSLVRITDLEGGKVGHGLTFHADSTAAGEGEVSCEVFYQGSKVPCYLTKDDDGRYTIDFTPQGSGSYVVHAYMNDMEVKGSPYTVDIVDSSRVTVTGEGLSLVPVNTPAIFTVHTNGAGGGKVDVDILAPSGQRVPARIAPLPDGRGMTVEYTPWEIGAHSIKASLAGLPIRGSPFHVRTFDPNKVKVSRVKQGIVGVPCKFNVDASEAGDGTLEIAVNHNGQNIPNNALTVGKNRYECSFIGQQEGSYRVSVIYNEIHAQGSPFSVNVVDVGGFKITGDSWNLVSCNKKAGFNLVSPHGSFEDMSIRIIAPDGSNVPCRLNERGDGTAKIEWHPSIIGAHKVYIDYAGVPIQGSPFTIKVFDASRVRVSNINPGMVNRPVSFTLDASEAGDGNLEILVMCGEEIVPNYVQDEGNTVFKVTFTPKRAGLHLIHTQFNGEAVRGSPHQCPVLDPESVQVTGDGVNMAAANSLTSFHVNMKHAGEAKLNVRVVSPYGEEIPVHVSGNARSGLRIDYTPHDVGLYKVYVECAGVPVKGSPFTCNVFDPALVRINAPGRAYYGKPIHFAVDTSAAGQGKLSFQVTCRGSEVPVRMRETAAERYDVTFTPQNIAPHLVHVYFNDLQVPGTPFEVSVIDSSSVTVAGDGLRLAKVFKEAGLTLEHRGLDERDLDIRIVAPSGNTIPARLNHHGNAARINFTPLEVGQHKIHVQVGDQPINGSPFICNVYDPSAVRIIDVDKTPKKEREIGFTIDSSAAGAGTLEVQITHKGQPVRAECRKIADGQYNYTFKPHNVGRYEVKATFNGDTIPGSPLIIEVEEDTPTFIRINFSSAEPMNAKGRNYFMLHMSGREVDRDMLNVMILG